MQDAKLTLWDIHTYLTRVFSHNFPNSINFTTGLLSLAAACRMMSPHPLQSVSQRLSPASNRPVTSQQNTKPQVTTKSRNHSNQHFQVLHTYSYHVFAAVTNVWQNPCPVRWGSILLVPNESYTEVPPWSRFVIDATSSPRGASRASFYFIWNFPRQMQQLESKVTYIHTLL